MSSDKKLTNSEKRDDIKPISRNYNSSESLFSMSSFGSVDSLSKSCDSLSKSCDNLQDICNDSKERSKSIDDIKEIKKNNYLSFIDYIPKEKSYYKRRLRDQTTDSITALSKSPQVSDVLKLMKDFRISPIPLSRSFDGDLLQESFD